MFPVLLKIGAFKLRTYGVFAFLAFLVGLFIARARSEKYGVSKREMEDLVFYSVLGGLVGARIFYVLFFFDYFKGKPFWKVFAIWEGGIMFVGGLIFGIISGLIYSKIKNIDWKKAADAVAPALAIAHAVARIGCFGYGCCFGKPTSLPWGVKFPVSSPAWYHYVVELGMKQLPRVHPTELYHSLSNLLIGVFLLLLSKKQKFPGQIFFLYIILYGVTRSLLDTLRADVPYIGPLTGSQIVLIPAVIVALYLYWRNARAREGR